jgi:hypothetical protein
MNLRSILKTEQKQGKNNYFYSGGLCTIILETDKQTFFVFFVLQLIYIQLMKHQCLHTFPSAMHSKMK